MGGASGRSFRGRSFEWWPRGRLEPVGIRCRMASASPAATMSGRGARNLLQFLRLVGQLKVSGRREGCLSSRLRGERPGPAAQQPGFRSPPGLRPAPFLGSPRLVGPTEGSPFRGMRSCVRIAGGGGKTACGIAGPHPRPGRVRAAVAPSVGLALGGARPRRPCERFLKGSRRCDVWISRLESAPST